MCIVSKPFSVLFYFDSRQLNRDLRNQKERKVWIGIKPLEEVDGWNLEFSNLLFEFFFCFQAFWSILNSQKSKSAEPAVCLGLDINMERDFFVVPLRLLEHSKKIVESPKKTWRNLLKTWRKKIGFSSKVVQPVWAEKYSIAAAEMSLSREIWSSVLIYISPGFMFALMENFSRNKFLCLFLCSSAKCAGTTKQWRG